LRWWYELRLFAFQADKLGCRAGAGQTLPRLLDDDNVVLHRRHRPLEKHLERTVKSSLAFRIFDYQVRLSLMKIGRQKGGLQQLQQQ
jgi:hypothetical protein